MPAAPVLTRSADFSPTQTVVTHFHFSCSLLLFSFPSTCVYFGKNRNFYSDRSLCTCPKRGDKPQGSPTRFWNGRNGNPGSKSKSTHHTGVCTAITATGSDVTIWPDRRSPLCVRLGDGDGMVSDEIHSQRHTEGFRDHIWPWQKTIRETRWQMKEHLTGRSVSHSRDTHLKFF